MADEFDPYYTWLGIRPEEQPPDHYRLMGLKQFEDNADVIANATDRQMQFLRSMQVGKNSAHSQTLLNEISAAGGCLLDPQRKGKYDQELRAKEAAKVQAAKAAAAKARPLRKATSLEPIPKPAQPSAAAPLPKSDVFSVQLTSGPAKPSATSSAATPAKAAPPRGLKSPVIIAAAGGGVLLIVVVISALGWMLSSEGDKKSSVANAPQAKAPVTAAPAKVPPVTPNTANVPTPKVSGKDKTGAKQQPPDLAKEFVPAKPFLPPAETVVAKINEPPVDPNWKPPTADSQAAFRSLLGTYMYSLDRAKMYPIVNLQVPSKNLWTPEIEDKVRGKVPYDEISYVGTAKIAVPADGIYILEAEKAARVHIDNQIVADWDTPKGEIRIAGGIHDFNFEIGSHGGNWMRETDLAIRHKETGEEVPFFNTWQDIQKFLATPINGQSITEVSGWQPSPKNELKLGDRFSAALAKTTAPMAPVVAANQRPSAPAKAPVPDAAAIDKARHQIVEVFGEESRGNTTPEKKLELAKKMLQVEKESRNDPALQYVLLSDARKLFAAAGEADMALATVDSLAEAFAIDPWPLKTETATALADVNVLPAARDRIAARLLAAIDEAAAAQQFGAAEDFTRLATKVSAKGKDVELRKSIGQKKVELNRLKQHFAKVEEARVRLTAKNDDPEANLVVGKFVALMLGDFDSGVPYLAKSGQELYAAAATAEQRALQGESGSPLAAADAWNKLAESLKGEDKGACPGALRRARDWYEIAAIDAQGLEKVRAQKRLKELQGLATTNLRKAYFTWPTTPDGYPLIDGVWDESRIPLIMVQKEGTFVSACEYDHPTDGHIRWEGDGTISKDGQMTLSLNHVQAPQSWTRLQKRTGQLSRDGGSIKGHASSAAGEHDFVWKLRGKSSTPPATTRPEKSAGQFKKVPGLVGRGYAAGRDVNLLFTYHPGHKLTRDEIQELQNNLGNEDIRVEFQGVLWVTADTDVAFHHVGGSSSGGVNYLYLDGKEVHAVGDDRTKDETLTLKLGKGDHTLRWAVTGGNLGDAQLEINMLNSDKNPAAKMEIYASAEMVSAARAGGVKQEFEYGTVPAAQEAPPTTKPPKSSEKRGRNAGKRTVARLQGPFDAVVVETESTGGGGNERSILRAEKRAAVSRLTKNGEKA